MAFVANSALMNHIEGIQQLKDALVVLVKTEWNAGIIDALEEGVVRVLAANGLRHHTLVVPGAVELAFGIRQAAAAYPDAVAYIAIGCVIKGDTPHFEYVCQSVTQGITQLNLSLDKAVIFGVLTVNTDEQAKERIGGKHGHKGEEAAITAIKMALLQKTLKGSN